MRLQTQKIVDQKILDLVSVCLDRIQSIALVHELLYNSSEFKLINIQTYVEKIVSYLFGHAAMDDPEVKIDVDEDLMELNSVIPCGLMLCEMVTNFKKYVKIEKPVLTISYKNNGTSRVLLVRDNGDGFSKSVLENLE
jgi:two-component sensor histidine kinase